MWYEALISIRFDLDYGPVVEHVVPEGALSTEGKKAIAKVGFPDCNPDVGHDFIYSFVTPSPLESSQVGSDQQPEELHGAAYYRQKRDPNCQRGYVQQAVVVLSRLPYLIVHELVLRTVSPSFGRSCDKSPDTATPLASSCLLVNPVVLFQSDGMPRTIVPAAQPEDVGRETQLSLLTRIWDELSTWPSPHPHVEYNLTLNNIPLHFVTPPAERMPSRYIDTAPALRLDDRVKLLGPSQTTCYSQYFLPVHSLLQSHLSNLTKLWELLVSHQPVLILSNTPSMSSAVALAVASLITPLRYVGEFRPYFTVQDSDFARISGYGKTPATPFPSNRSMIIAGTNPFFVRAFTGWKNALSISDINARQGSGGMTPQGSRDSEPTTPTTMPTQPTSPQAMSPVTKLSALGLASTSTPNHKRSGSVGSSGGFGSPAANSKNGKGWESLLWGFKEVFCSDAKFVLDHKEQTSNLMQRLSQAMKVPPGTTSAMSSTLPENTGSREDEMLRKFFISMTTEFLQPLQNCFNTIASQTQPFQLCCATSIDLFNTTHFVQHVEEAPLPRLFAKRKRKDVVALYERFIFGELFAHWLRDNMDQFIKTQLQHFDSSAEVDGIPEMQVLDMFLNLQRYIAKEERAVDPDVVLVSSATATLAELAMHVSEPLRDDLLSKLENVRLRF